MRQGELCERCECLRDALNIFALGVTVKQLSNWGAQFIAEVTTYNAPVHCYPYETCDENELMLI